MSEIFTAVFNGVNRLTNQSIVNVYNYWVDDEFVPLISDCQFLAEQAHNMISPAAIQVLSDQYRLLNVTVTADSNKAQYIYDPSNYTDGLRAGQAAPAQLAWSFKLQRQTTLTKSGGKRYSPILRDDVLGNGQPTSGSILAALAILASMISNPLEDHTTGWTYVPIIWGRMKNKLPVSIVNPIAFAYFTEATTQKTRQRGIGT